MDCVSDESSTDCEEMPYLISTTQSVTPYMYEPILSSAQNASNSDESSESDSDDSHFFKFSTEENEDSLLDEEVDEVNLWCSCQHCMTMQTRSESKCCKDMNIVDGKMEEAGISCITEHDGFQANCLNEHVLETSYYEYLEEHEPNDQSIHELYRYIAYRRFVRWIFQRLGQKQRKILPSCVVKAIREKFPSQQYCGFKYPN
ncbi:hypothetical protein ACJMK2_003691 [Sinanodonta woodiana]|uniref:P2X purinoreceptor 7 intracellular domain-containing protein n=1 Tax=Sinanodonta woodiana TaxID=1069815 RepID=A0ABD3XN91_SINWO